MKMIVCPQVLEKGTQYGKEHALAAKNHGAYFNQTMTHTTGGHPILPDLTYNPNRLRGEEPNKEPIMRLVE
jgi:hypothetical protein